MKTITRYIRCYKEWNTALQEPIKSKKKMYESSFKNRFRRADYLSILFYWLVPSKQKLINDDVKVAAKFYQRTFIHYAQCLCKFIDAEFYASIEQFVAFTLDSFLKEKKQSKHKIRCLSLIIFVNFVSWWNTFPCEHWFVKKNSYQAEHGNVGHRAWPPTSRNLSWEVTIAFRKINICGAEQQGLRVSLHPKALLSE